MRNLTKVLISLCFFYSFQLFSLAQPILNWNKIYDYNHYQDLPSQVTVDDSGNIFVVGQSEISNAPATNFDGLVLKYDQYGNLLWARLKHLANWGGNDIYLRALTTEEGKVFASGSMQVDNTSKMYNAMYSSDGTILWNDTKNYDTYWPYKCRNIFESDSCYFITDVYYASNSLKIALLKYNKLGQFISVCESQEFIGSPENIAFSGSSFLMTYSIRNNNYQYHSIVRKINLLGEVEWETLITDTVQSISCVKSISDINSDIYSISNKVNDDSSAIYLTKLNHQGKIVWDTIFVFENNYFGFASDVTISDSGIIKIVGTCTYWDGNTSQWGTFVALYDRNGNFINYKRQIIPYTVQNYTEPKYDEFGNVYWSFGIQNSMGYLDILVIKIDETGELEYEFVYSHNNNPTYDEEPMDMYIVDEDNFVVSARGAGLAEAYNILLLRYGSNFTSIEDKLDPQVTSYCLEQNFPNPFNPSTSIQFAINGIQFVTLKVYDVLGKEIATLVNEEKPVGNYEAVFNASHLASGIYYYQLRTGDFIQTKKMVLIK